MRRLYPDRDSNPDSADLCHFEHCALRFIMMGVVKGSSSLSGGIGD